MENVSMIAAIGKNGELGKNNELIWRFREDLKTFKEYTMGHSMVMGYNTFFSLRGGKPLPGRRHIVLTQQHVDTIEKNDQIIIVSSMEDLLDYIESKKEEIIVIGGARMYANMLQYTKKIVLTEIDAFDQDADTFFPKINVDEWNRTLLTEQEENGIKYKRLLYVRK